MHSLSSFSITLLLLASSVSSSPVQRRAKYWSGFKGVQKWFSFGDSYTQTGFVPTGAQPSPSNPFGNPAYPGYTSSNGPNWLDFVTTTYNESFIDVYNLAYGGATVDASLVAPYESTVLSFIDQVNQEYLPIYTGSNNTVGWTSSNSIFSFFFGINDIGNSYYNQNATLYDVIISEYAGLVEKIYQTGGRNFLFLNVPPVDLSPGTAITYGSSASQQENTWISYFNNKISGLASNFTANHSDATTFVFDIHNVFENIIKNPKTYTQSSGILNTTNYCTAYENGTPTEDYLDPSCGIPVQEYFWLNTLHPVFPVHNASGAQLANQLAAS
ncbi:carbohydrate esterase family 16 protein [Viridothelium virens]|uniref:Carbohydrate esterase family 16 protein n=1 Tax=Viridothelium virens TaxID=1048519 RepID=A0A6A6H8G6_VIRVR|nr:carbohydrate esterase family 16 protein [Viridothelium virens]